MESRESLLQSTLGQADTPATWIYSARTGYLSSFFGGPLAGAAIALVNAYRLKRLAKDWPIGLLAAAETIGALWWWRHGGESWVVELVGRDAQQILFRILGLGFFFLVYGWHREYYRNMAVLGIKPESGAYLGIAAVVGGLVATFALGAALS